MKDRKTKMELSEIGRIPPQARELEEVVIGALLIETTALDRVSFLKSCMFYNYEHQLIFEAIIILSKENRPIDILTVTEQLLKSDNLEEVGGPFYITQLSSKVASSAHIEAHAEIIKQKYIRRKTIEILYGLQSKAYDELEDVEDMLRDAGKGIEEMQEDLIGKNDIESLADISVTALSDLDRRIKLHNSGNQTGIYTGLCDLNKITSGWQKSELVVIAARPAMGKTAMALHFAKSASKSGVPVSLFSLEMSKVSLYNRLLLSECDINPDSFKEGNIKDEDYNKINSGFDSLYHLPIYVDDNASVTMSYIRSRCRLLKKQKKCEMVIIDYLQLVSGTRDKNGTREQEISAMSREAKLIAKELDIPVLLLSQLSREVEKRADKKPMLSDLRESGAIEQDADMVIFIYRPEYYNLTDGAGNDFKNEGKLIIAKNRNGKTGDVKFRYNDSLTRIFDYDSFNYNSYI